MLAALLAFGLQQMATPNPFATPAPFATPPVSVSERATMNRALTDAQTSAQGLGGVLGATVIDLTTGVEADTNADATFSMGAVQRLPVAFLAYRAIDAGTLPPSAQSLITAMVRSDDDGAEDQLVQLLHGPDALDAALHALSFDSIFIEPNDGGYATPAALAQMLSAVSTHALLSKTSSDALLKLLGQIGGDGLRGGLPGQALLQHVSGTVRASEFRIANDAGIAQIPGHTLLMVAMLRVPGGTDAQRDAVIAQVARAAVTAATATPGQ